MSYLVMTKKYFLCLNLATIWIYLDLASHMDKKKSPFERTGSSRSGKIKKLVNDFTEIKRPPHKSKVLDNNESHGQTKTNGKSFRVPENEDVKTHAKVTKKTQNKEEETSQTCTNTRTRTTETSSDKKQEKTDISIDSTSHLNNDIVPEIEKKVEEFGEKLKQRRTKQQDIQSTSKDEEEDVREDINSLDFQCQDEKTLEENTREQICDSFHSFDGDDIFGLNDFSEDCADNYIIETYNDYGRELIITQLEIKRTSLSPEDIENPIIIDELLEDPDYVFYSNPTGDKLEDLDIPENNLEEESNHNDYSSESLEEQPENETTSCFQKPDLVFYENTQLNENVINDFSESVENSSEDEHFYHNENFINSAKGEDDNETSSLQKLSSITQDSSDSDIYEEIDDCASSNLNKNISEQKNNDYNTTDLAEEKTSLFIRLKSERIQGDNFYHNLHHLQEYDSDDIFLEENHNLLKTKSEKKDKISFVIDELIKTEELYILNLRTVVKKYMPHIDSKTRPDLTGKSSYIFGNIQNIYEAAKKFLELLKKCNQSADEIAKVFIKCSHLFDLYPQYSKNKPTADLYLREFDQIVKNRQRDLGDKLGLASYLLTPIQRLGKYVLMLENIQKELNKTGQTLESVNAAINIIRNVMRKGNDFIAIDSIKQCKIDLTLHGSFIMRASFNVLKPRKFTSMVFLFEKVIVFTQKAAKNMEQFNYVDSIQMTDLSLGKFEDKPYVFHLTDYLKLKKSNHETVTYVLEAETPKIKNDWTMAIEAKLWSQLQKAKEQQKQMNFDEGKRLSKVPLQRTSLMRRFSSSKKEKPPKPKSTFYDEHIGTL